MNRADVAENSIVYCTARPRRVAVPCVSRLPPVSFYRNPVLSPSGASRFTKTYFDARASPRTADPQVFPVIPCHPCDSSLRDFSPRDGRDPAR